MADTRDEGKISEMPAVDERRPKDEALPLDMMNIGMTAGFRLLKAMAPTAYSNLVPQ